MAEEENENIETETDIFQQQKKTIDTLINVLEQQGGGPAGQPVYVSQPQAQQEKTPNYILWAAIGLVAFMLLKK